MEIKELIIAQKSILENILSAPQINYEDALSCINCIIDLKFLANYSGEDTVYLDFKKFIKYYIVAVDTKDNGYDKINIKIIHDKASRFNNLQKLEILKFLKRELLKNAFTIEASECDNFISAVRINICKKNFNYKNAIIYLGLLTSRNIFSLLLTFFIIILFTYVVTLPAPFESMVVLDITFLQLSTDNFTNRILNIFTLYLDFEDKMGIKAVSFFGVCLLAFLKIIYITIFINYFWKKIVDKLKID